MTQCILELSSCGWDFTWGSSYQPARGSAVFTLQMHRNVLLSHIVDTPLPSFFNTLLNFLHLGAVTFFSFVCLIFLDPRTPTSFASLSCQSPRSQACHRLGAHYKAAKAFRCGNRPIRGVILHSPVSDLVTSLPFCLCVHVCVYGGVVRQNRGKHSKR